ncbi:MAG: hypothetical protein QOD39_4112, partial [Mycobacterium sp.]|nr:hypothetical protein [Mycobacterium sp.]
MQADQQAATVELEDQRAQAIQILRSNNRSGYT